MKDKYTRADEAYGLHAPVHDDFLLPLVKPALRTEPRLRLRRRGRHHEERRNTDDQRQDTLNEEQPPPTGPPSGVTKAEDTDSEERADDVVCIIRHPEPREPVRQLVLGVKIRQIKDHVGNEAALHEAKKAPRRRA